MRGSAEWKEFVAARKELDAIDQREKKQWQLFHQSHDCEETEPAASMGYGTEGCVRGAPVSTNASGIEAAMLPSGLETRVDTERIDEKSSTSEEAENEPTGRPCCEPTNKVSPPDTQPVDKHAKDCFVCMA
jgi:hypothetical protein